MKKIIQTLVALCAVMAILSSCDDSKSYADLLKEEDKAVKAFFADKWVINQIPADSVFITLEQANNDTLAVPYYKMDNDGNVYMQVLNAGDLNDRFEKGEDVNIRFLRRDLKALMNGNNPSADGNTNPLDAITIRFGDTSLSSTTQYGSGLQEPLLYLGNECHVNLVIRSKAGFTSEVSYVLPFLYNVRYYKSRI